MYGAEPDGSDKFGGDIALLDHPGLKGLHNNVVYVEGHVDPQAQTRTASRDTASTTCGNSCQSAHKHRASS